MLFYLSKIYQKGSSSRLSMLQVEAIRTRFLLNIAARSIPRSSNFNIFKKSPTLCEIGFKENLHFSFRLGKGTMMLGKPFTYFIVTERKKDYQFDI